MCIMCLYIWCWIRPGWVGVNFFFRADCMVLHKVFFSPCIMCVCVYKYIYVILK